MGRQLTSENTRSVGTAPSHHSPLPGRPAWPADRQTGLEGESENRGAARGLSGGGTGSSPSRGITSSSINHSLQSVTPERLNRGSSSLSLSSPPVSEDQRSLMPWGSSNTSYPRRFPPFHLPCPSQRDPVLRLDTGPFAVHSGGPAPGLGSLGIWPVAQAADRPRRCAAVAGCTPASTSPPAPGLPSVSQTPPHSGAHPSASR